MIRNEVKAALSNVSSSVDLSSQKVQSKYSVVAAANR